jgi:hypothetical protein
MAELIVAFSNFATVSKFQVKKARTEFGVEGALKSDKEIVSRIDT